MSVVVQLFPNDEVELSEEDNLWIEAIAQRTVVTLYWEYERAFRTAKAEVLDFIKHNKEDNDYEYDREQELHDKRLVYENETKLIIERKAREEEETQKEVERWKKLMERRHENDIRRDVLHNKMKPEFDKHGSRNRWVVNEYLSGRTLRSVGEQIGISAERVRGIVAKERQLDFMRWRRLLNPIKPKEYRPIDMGGPRDVWLSYYPSPDPRLDNMEPVHA